MTRTVPMLRTSERKDFRRCPWLWDQTWNQGWRSRREPTWAWFGTAIHKGLEARYPVGKKRGSVEDMLGAFEARLNDEIRRVHTEGGELDTDLAEEEIVDAKELGRAMLLGYVEEYGTDSHWQVIHSEQAFQIDVPHPTKDRTLVVYCGTWDMVVYDLVDKVYKVVDHKTRKVFPGETGWAFYQIDDQAGSYLWVAPEVLRHVGVFKGDEAIEGLVFNALRKRMPDNRPLDENGLAHNKPQKVHYYAALDGKNVPYARKDTIPVLHSLAEQHGLTVWGEVSARQPVARYHREEVDRTPEERVTQAQRVQGEAVWMDLVRKGKLPALKHTGEDCIRCPLFDMCQLHEQDPEAAWELRKATMIKRDPYRDHRDAMKEGGVEVHG